MEQGCGSGGGGCAVGMWFERRRVCSSIVFQRLSASFTAIPWRSGVLSLARVTTGRISGSRAPCVTSTLCHIHLVLPMNALHVHGCCHAAACQPAFSSSGFPPVCLPAAHLPTRPLAALSTLTRVTASPGHAMSPHPCAVVLLCRAALRCAGLRRCVAPAWRCCRRLWRRRRGSWGLPTQAPPLSCSSSAPSGRQARAGVQQQMNAPACRQRGRGRAWVTRAQGHFLSRPLHLEATAFAGHYLCSPPARVLQP